MITNKHITKIIIAVTSLAVAFCLVAVACSGVLSNWLGGTGVSMEYESKLFDTNEIISVDIQMDEDDWNEMLSNAISEEYYVCDVTVNGKTVKNVAIRPKGNTSLSSIAMNPDTDRYSLKLEFDHFVEGQTCYGLDKLILNNNYADATNMKEAIVYDMYGYLGADASLYNYAKVSVNGEYRGVYLALEGVEESFMLRNFGTQDGELYKPDSMEMGGGDGDAKGGSMPNMDMSDVDLSQFEGKTPPSKPDSSSDGEFSFNPEDLPEDFDMSNLPDMGSFGPGNMPDANNSGDEQSGSQQNDGENKTKTDKGSFSPSGKGGFSSGGGANLNYSDDELDSYSTIWDGEITGTSKADHRRVVTALKNISEGTDLETYLDVDNILKYMAVHTFAVNMDSLSGSMAHNYYLHEYDGQLNLFPWDYNLSFGGMSNSGDATSVINDAIDTPFSGTGFFDALLENEEYLEIYHAYLQQLVDEYVNGGRFDEVYSRIRSQIDSLVETDPTAFYTADEYNTAAELLYKTVKLRARSISGQLDGTIPSTDEGQREDSSSLIDASDIDIKAMGEFDMGGKGDGRDSGAENNQPASSEEKEMTAEEAVTEEPVTEETTTKATEEATAQSSDQPAQGNPPSGMPGDFDPNNLPDGFDPENMPQGGFGPSGAPPDGNFGFDGENMPDMGQFDMNNPPDGFNPDNVPSQNNDAESETQTTESSSGQSEQPEAKEQSEKETSDSKRPDFSGMPSRTSSKTNVKSIVTIGICLAAMIIALVVIKLIKRK